MSRRARTRVHARTSGGATGASFRPSVFARKGASGCVLRGLVRWNGPRVARSTVCWRPPAARHLSERPHLPNINAEGDTHALWTQGALRARLQLRLPLPARWPRRSPRGDARADATLE